MTDQDYIDELALGDYVAEGDTDEFIISDLKKEMADYLPPLKKLKALISQERETQKREFEESERWLKEHGF